MELIRAMGQGVGGPCGQDTVQHSFGVGAVPDSDDSLYV